MPHRQIGTVFDLGKAYSLFIGVFGAKSFQWAHDRQPPLPLWHKCHVRKQILIPDGDMNNPVLRFSGTNGETIHHRMMSLKVALISFVNHFCII